MRRQQVYRKTDWLGEGDNQDIAGDAGAGLNILAEQKNHAGIAVFGLRADGRLQRRGLGRGGAGERERKDEE